MGYTQDIFGHICKRASDKHEKDLGDRMFRFDGFMRDFVAEPGIPSGEICLRYGLLNTSPTVLQGAAKPKLVTVEVTLDLVITGITAKNREANYKVLDDLMDEFSQNFTPGQLDDPSNWSLAGLTPITSVSQGDIIPNVTPDYISRGFQLNIKATV